jgi:hypothetical protein
MKLTSGARVAVIEGGGGRLEKAWSENENVFPAKTRSTCGLDGPAGRFRPVGDGVAGGLAGLRGRVGRKIRRAEMKKKRISELKIRFLNLPRLWKFVEEDLGGILTWGFFLNSSRLLKDLEKYNMPCRAMHPIQDLLLESFSYVL